MKSAFLAYSKSRIKIKKIMDNVAKINGKERGKPFLGFGKKLLYLVLSVGR